MRRTLVGLVIFTFALASALLGEQPSADVVILAARDSNVGWQVVAIGGTSAVSESYAVAGTAGQLAIGIVSSQNYGVNHGFWQTFGPGYICGDANADGVANITDAVYLIQYIFADGPPPVPLLAGDANCDGVANITDAVYIIQYIFSGGAEPCAECP